MIKLRTSILLLSFISTIGANAATLLVTNLHDDGSPGSLRETIARASGGDSIQFAVAGTITLQEAFGALRIDKELTIDGHNAIIIDCAHHTNIGFYITEASANNTHITNITIQNSNGHGSTELPAYGILCSHTITDCTIVNVTITNINSGKSQEAAGISCSHLTSGKISNNHIEAISSEDTIGSSGSLYGIKTGSPSELFNNRIHTLASGPATDNSGEVIGIDADTINPYNNTITHLTSGEAHTNTGRVIGIRATCFINSINNTIEALSSGPAEHTSGLVRGIWVEQEILKDCAHNHISQISSGSAHNTSGSVVGIMLQDTVHGECLHNTIQNLSSGSARTVGGIICGIFGGNTLKRNCSSNTIQQITMHTTDHADYPIIGIFVNTLEGNCINNLITDIAGADGIPSAQTGGIQCSCIADSGLFTRNKVQHITGGHDNCTFAIAIEKGNKLTINHNHIDTLTNTAGPAHGFLLGNTHTFVTNSLINDNTVSNLTGDANNRFGISMFGTQSTGNNLLRNSINTMSGKAINSIDNAVPVDATIVLHSVVCNDDQTVRIHGTLEPETDFEYTQFLLQFFISEQALPPQTTIFLGETTVQATGATTPFVAELPINTPSEANYITATATALPSDEKQNNNSSEVSNSITSCDTTP